MLSLWIQTTNDVFEGSRALFLNGVHPPITWPFKGATIREQEMNVRLLAQAMQGGRGRLVTQVTTLLDIDMENLPGGASQFVDFAFGSADEFYFERGLPLIDVIADELSLLDVLADVGTAILAAL